MKIHASLPFALLALTACAHIGDTPTTVTAPEPIGSYRSDLGLKPPPPLGSEETSISISVGADDVGSERQSGPSAASTAMFPGFSANIRGRYFANTPNRNAWIQFESFGSATASPDARLQYNEKTGRTNGRGTLTDGNGVVLDLSLLEIDAGSVFGVCGSGIHASCAHFPFLYDGNKVGVGSVSRVPPSAAP